jgi:DNA-binding response OmpR family regulator
MNAPLTRKKSIWSKQEAIVVSENENFHMMVRQLLRTYNWTTSVSTNSVRDAIDSVRIGKVSLVILDDTRELPAIRTLRAMMADTVCLLTPVLAIISEACTSEISMIQMMGRPGIIQKPFTPSKFVPVFSQLVKTWEKPPFLNLRSAADDFIQGNTVQGIKKLGALLDNKEVLSFSAQVIALRYRAAGKLKEAEAILLKTLKLNPRNISIILSLVDLYNEAAMPHLARKFLNVAQNSYTQATSLIPDMVQTDLMMGNLEEAIFLLMPLFNRNALDIRSVNFLARLLLAEGREQEAERVMIEYRGVLKKMSEIWNLEESTPEGQLSKAS